MMSAFGARIKNKREVIKKRGSITPLMLDIFLGCEVLRYFFYCEFFRFFFF